MKRIVIMALALIAFVGGAKSQNYEAHWTLSYDQYTGGAGNMPVHAMLNLGTSSSGTDPDWSQYEVAAFVGDEVRAIAFAETSAISAGFMNYFMLNVVGNFDQEGKADEGKSVTFKMFNHATGVEYNLTPESAASFGSEKTIGSYADKFELSAIELTNLTLEDFEMTVGETVDLNTLLKLTPANATMPNNVGYEARKAGSALTLNGSVLTANEEGVWPVNMACGNNFFSGIEVTVKKAAILATAIHIRDGYETITVSRGNVDWLNTSLSNAYILTPFDAEEVVHWVITSTDGSVIEGVIPGQFEPVKKGTTRMQAQIWDANNLPRLKSEELTVVVTIDVENITYELTPNSPLAQGGSAVLTLTPNEGATIDPVSINVSDKSDGPWNLLSISTPVAQSDGSVKVPITALYPGTGKIVVKTDYIYPNDPNYMNIELEADYVVGVPLTLKKGWQWKTLWWYVDEEQYAAAFNFVDEIRSQDDLLTYDPQEGFFGSLYPSPHDGLKINARADVSADNAYLQTGRNSYSYGNEWDLKKAWTWLYYGFVHSVPLSAYFTKYDKTTDQLVPAGDDGDRVVSKDDGFAEFSNGAWTGTLTQLKPYEMYLYYNNSGAPKQIEWDAEATLIASGSRTDVGNVVIRHLHESGWEYDASRFRDNMSVVACVDGLPDARYFTVGAFVGDECRGEGVLIGDCYFITVHADRGEQVSFRLKSNFSGKQYAINETVPMNILVGSVKSPLKLTSPSFTTGIENVSQTLQSGSVSYDLNGRRVASTAKGITLQRQADGSVKKVVIK